MRHRGSMPCLIAVVFAALAVPVAEADDAPRFEMTPTIGYRIGGRFDVQSNATDVPDTSVDVGDGATYGLDLGLYRDAQGFYELLYSHQGASLDAKTPDLDGLDVDIEYYQFGGTAFFPEAAEKVLPYLSFTLGATRFSAAGYDSETKFSGTLGAGVRVPLGAHLAAVLGLRGYLTLIDSKTEFLCVSNGGDAGCLLKASGSTFFQGEAQLGLALRF